MLVPNTGEANDEMCAPLALMISEMCALRLENNNRLRPEMKEKKTALSLGMQEISWKLV